MLIKIIESLVLKKYLDLFGNIVWIDRMEAFCYRIPRTGRVFVVDKDQI
jgi:hypothetical protein